MGPWLNPMRLAPRLLHQIHPASSCVPPRSPWRQDAAAHPPPQRGPSACLPVIVAARSDCLCSLLVPDALVVTITRLAATLERAARALVSHCSTVETSGPANPCSAW